MTSPKNEGSMLGKEIENISAMELSHKEIDIKEIQNSVRQVIEEGEKGRFFSRKLIEDIHPDALKLIKDMGR